MAKAQFHKSQRVFVKPVGTWALVEKVIPHWVKDVGEPLRVTYECGLGREFQANELISEETMRANQKQAPHSDNDEDLLLETWRIVRQPVKWRDGANALTTATPSTFPAIVTDEGEKGGWRVPGLEYDEDPDRIEHQARMIVCTPELIRVARKISEFSAENPDKCPTEMKPVLKQCAELLRFVYQLDDETAVTVAAE